MEKISFESVVPILNEYLSLISKVNLKKCSKITYKYIHIKDKFMKCICNYTHHFNCNCNCNCCSSCMSF